MKVFVVPALALCATAAMAQQVETDRALVEHPASHNAKPDYCKNRITEVRAANGQPKLDRRPSSPDDAQFIAAVDQRIDGCSVMVMRGDTSDIRPLPTRSAEGGFMKID